MRATTVWGLVPLCRACYNNLFTSNGPPQHAQIDNVLPSPAPSYGGALPGPANEEQSRAHLETLLAKTNILPILANPAPERQSSSRAREQQLQAELEALDAMRLEAANILNNPFSAVRGSLLHLDATAISSPATVLRSTRRSAMPVTALPLISSASSTSSAASLLLHGQGHQDALLAERAPRGFFSTCCPCARLATGMHSWETRLRSTRRLAPCFRVQSPATAVQSVQMRARSATPAAAAPVATMRARRATTMRRPAACVRSRRWPAMCLRVQSPLPATPVRLRVSSSTGIRWWSCWRRPSLLRRVHSVPPVRSARLAASPATRRACFATTPAHHRHRQRQGRASSSHRCEWRMSSELWEQAA